MRTRERGSRRVMRPSVLALIGGLALLGSWAAARDEESWEEKVPPAAGRGRGGSGGKEEPKAKGEPTPAPRPAPTAVPRPKAAAVPTPDPKKLTKADFACQKQKATAEAMIKIIEDKRAQGSPTNRTVLDDVYDSAYKQAGEDLKQRKPNATQAELDAAGKQAARDAIHKAYAEGKVNTDTGESFGDSYRREWEGANRGTPVPPPSDAVPANASDYMKQCAKENVPLPPKWGDPKWVYQGDVPKNKVLAFGLPINQVWVSKSPRGVCYTLARMAKPDEIQRLDQICQSEQTGKACFWANASPKDGDTPVKVTKGLDPANVAGGDKLKMNCTACHRGDNAFIIHPGTPLQPGPSDPCEKADPTSRLGPTDPRKRFQPIGRARDPKVSGDPEDQAGFENPTDEYAGLGDGPCSACHGIPKLSYSYCAFVALPMIDNGEMPPKAPPPAPPENPTKYKKDIADLKKACQAAMNEHLAE